MKKTDKTKLKLGATTVRVLASEQLARIAGGWRLTWPTDPPPTSEDAHNCDTRR